MGPLDKYRPVYSAPKETGIEPAFSFEDVKEYGLILQEYVKHRRELREYRRRNEASPLDQEVMSWGSILNSQIHDWHGQLEQAGAKIGKGEYDVIVDILRQEGNLESAGFNLPEFSLLTTDDMFLGHAGGQQFVPQDGTVPRRSADENINIGVGNAEGNRFFAKDDALIVFEVSLYEGKGAHYHEWVIHAPDSYAREQRMRALAKQLDTRTMWFEDADPEEGFHAHSISLGGVVIKKKDIEYVGSMIRDNPNRYRLGKEFYTEDEIDKNRERFVESLNAAYNEMGKYGDHRRLLNDFLERIRSVYGKEAFKQATETYAEWYPKNKDRLFLD